MAFMRPRHAIVALAAAAFAASPAAAAGGPLTLQQRAHLNRHYAGNTGADGRHASSDISLELLPGGKLRLEDSGMRRSYHSDGAGRVDSERTEWSLAYTGRWKRRGGVLRLTLIRGEDRCKRESKRYGQPTKVATCARPRRATALRCELTTIKAGGGSHKAWQCLPTTAKPAGTPGPWVFGLKRCLRALGGRPGTGRIHYALCSKGP